MLEDRAGGDQRLGYGAIRVGDPPATNRNVVNKEQIATFPCRREWHRALSNQEKGKVGEKIGGVKLP